MSSARRIFIGFGCRARRAEADMILCLNNGDTRALCFEPSASIVSVLGLFRL